MCFQDTPLPAKDLILEQPIKVVEGRVVVSGGGSTGHPINFLNLVCAFLNLASRLSFANRIQLLPCTVFARASLYKSLNKIF